MQVIGRQLPPSPCGVRLHHERHRPEQTTADRPARKHAATFVTGTEAAAGADLPQLVKAEFDAFLLCGIPLAHGWPCVRGPACRVRAW